MIDVVKIPRAASDVSPSRGVQVAEYLSGTASFGMVIVSAAGAL
jgi:hypothetical protein